MVGRRFSIVAVDPAGLFVNVKVNAVTGSVLPTFLGEKYQYVPTALTFAPDETELVLKPNDVSLYSDIGSG